MNTRTILILIGALALIVGLFLWGSGSRGGALPKPTTGSGSTKGSFLLPPPEYDFGEVSMARGNVTHDFVLANDTKADLTVVGAYTSCMCTTAVLLFADGNEFGPFGMAGHGFIPAINKVVKPGEKLTVRAIFDPAAHGPAGIGPVERQVVLELADRGQFTVGFRAQVTP